MSKQMPHEIIDRASEWFIEMREMDISDSTREAFTEWLRSSPAHVQAYLEVAGLWGDASQVAKDFPVELAGAGTNVVALEKVALEKGKRPGLRTIVSPDPGTVGSRASPSVSVMRLRARRGPLAIAAALILAIATATTWWQVTRAPTYTADIGEQRVITLEDGSIVRLNSRSKIRVDLTPHQRNIELLEGQAHFQVAKDTARPFNVYTDDITARAVGTQFDVYRRKTGTTVTVVEGRVALITSDSAQAGAPVHSTDEETRSDAATDPRARSGDGPHAVLLAAGQQATATRSGTVELQPEANITAATGWLQQELIFTGEPLSTVIDEFNRYTRRTIVLDDPALAEFKINAAFHTTNPQGLLLFLSRMDGVTINETETEVHITRREPQQ